jgi:CRISPR-associated protein Cas2
MPTDPTDWRQALAAWNEAREEEAKASEDREKGGPPVGWWLEAFPNPPNASERRGHRCGDREMLAVVAYDIADPKRLQRVAKHCEDFGLRVQYSVFECRLEAETFERFWKGMQAIIDPDSDRIVAYRICAACARAISTAGVMTVSSDVVAYVM